MDENRKQIFMEELEKLRQAHLIHEHDFRRLITAHDWYEFNLQRFQQPGTASPQAFSPQNMPNQAVYPQNMPVHGTYPQPAHRHAQKPQPPAPPVRLQSPQDIRDRNITWVLILGVVFVLMSGLILATSNWSMMGSIAKTGIITFVTVLFFGLSIFTDKSLKIRKTAFAFWVLGSLFLPVAVLSAGFFELFGAWLSIFGDGKYVLGVMGTSICIPVYAYSSTKYSNRFFTWLTLVTISLNVVFLIAACKPPVDLFYLGIVLYNVLIAGIYAKKALPEKFSRFTSELPAFIQINLVISTIFMLTFFDEPILHGFNVILTAVLYILVTFSSRRKEYSFVFNGLLVYGIWQVVENSPLASIDAVLFALAGFLFLGFERLSKEQDFLKKTFIFTSGIISLCTFLFINLRGIALNSDNASFAMLVAFLLIAANYGYLAYRTKRAVFAWLTPIFLISVGYQGFKLIERIAPDYSFSLHMFLVSVLMFVCLHYINQWKYSASIRTSSGAASLLLMTFSAVFAAFQEEWGLAAIAFACIGMALYLVYRKTQGPLLKTLIRISLPLASVLALFSFFGVIQPPLDSWYQLEIHGSFMTLAIFGSSILFRKIEPSLEKPFFQASHILVPLAVLAMFEEYHANPLMFIIPGAIYLYSMRRSASREPNRFLACGFLYLVYTAGILTLFSTIEALRLPSPCANYAIPFSSIILVTIWLFMKGIWKHRTMWYFLPVSLFAIPSLLVIFPFGIPEFILTLMFIGLTLFVLHRSKTSLLAFAPLLLLIPVFAQFYVQILGNDKTGMLLALVMLHFLLKYAGEFLFKRLYRQDPEGKGLGAITFDWYTTGALFVLPFIGMLTSAMNTPDRLASEWLGLIMPVLFTFLLFSQRNRVGSARKMADTIWIVSTLLPYIILMQLIDPPMMIGTELYCLPLIVISLVLSMKVWAGREDLFRKIQLGVLLFIAAALMRDILAYGFVADALITGILSLTAVFVGMQFRVKSYFFVGSGTLLLNALIQTKSFWGSIPWWGYLLVAGLILIAIASINEMQKGDRENTPKFSGKAVIEKFRSWK